MIPSKPVNFLAPMIAFAVALLLLSRFLEFPSLSSPLPTEIPSSSSILSTPSSPSSLSPSLNSRPKEAFSDLKAAFARWDEEIGCERFRERNGGAPNASAVQDYSGSVDCEGLGPAHVSVLVKGWTWIPDNLDNLYSCRCGLSCLWTKSPVMADKPDALLFENVMPPARRRKGDPLRVYMDLEASRKPSGFEDIFIGYHANDDVQSTYAGSLFHNNRNYYISSHKLNDTLIYWSSSRCLAKRNQLAGRFLSLVPHHSFGKCLNNVGGLDMVLSFYPECSNGNSLLHWWDHLHCAMSHYKFVLAIENTVTESYVTEKLYYALDAGAVPIYFGAPNVWDFVPPNSIIDGSKFSSMSELASYVKAVADDPVAYAEFHGWRRCGVLGNYGRVRAASLDTLPCRLCEFVSRKEARERRR
ncbi:alpha-(1,4)-fucosyltransferase [Dendrobium catenatum]|uniref:Fucosyltransferase n=1 Tax=Dendrobium catenatum TaxID=906689 RepID=A0A2I0W593_9ASPA|nr:alpha-(1,4)-fucosyltransferase [Dendrobium catenatum]PKU70828.1 Alpha-(1,4)-fucosyltransferase [Dendrobium catenatum]